MTDRQKAIAAILAAIPALLFACSSWVQAKAKQEEAKAAWAGYGDYVTDQLHRDEAILKALKDCQRTWQDIAQEGPTIAYMAPGGAVAGLVEPKPQPQADAVLDELARSRGWEPGGTKQ